MIKYKLFANLYFEALDYKDSDMYVAERGWQEWMNEFEGTPEFISKLLFDIYDLATLPLKEIREKYGISRASACRLFRVPVRTFEDWENKNQILEYTKCLLCYAMYVESLNNIE